MAGVHYLVPGRYLVCSNHWWQNEDDLNTGSVVVLFAMLSEHGKHTQPRRRISRWGQTTMASKGTKTAAARHETNNLRQSTYHAANIRTSSLQLYSSSIVLAFVQGK